MKRRHKPYRPLIEVVGFMLLAISIWTGRHVIADSIDYMRDADKVFVIVAFGLAWLNFLWSGLGYRLLVKKPISLLHMCLTHLAASGPGRVIPAGGGHLGFGILFLRKHGHTLPAAIAIGTINNIIGLIVNSVILFVVFAVRPTILSDLPLSATSVYAVLAGLVMGVLVLYLLKRSRHYKKGTSSVQKQLQATAVFLKKNPARLFTLVITMIAMIVTHSVILYLVAQAIDVNISVLQAFVAMSTGVAVGSLLPTPGGVGGVEAGIIASLYSIGIQTDTATAIALLYRAATYIQPLIPGCFAYIYLRRRSLL